MKNQIRTIIQQIVITLITGVIAVFGYQALAAPLTQSSVPMVIPYQGTLTNASGQPINSNTNFTFAIYNTQSGGTALWTESQSNVPVQNGLFNVRLGSVTPIPSTVWNNNPLYVGVKVGNDAEMSPREMVGAVPFAITAGSVQSLPDGIVTSRKVNLNSGIASINSNAAPLNLTSTNQDIPGATATIQADTNSVVMVMATFDMASSNTVVGELWLDGAIYTDGAIGYQAIHEGGGRNTVSQIYRIPLTPGSHTLQLKSRTGSGSGTIWHHTRLMWFVVGN